MRDWWKSYFGEDFFQLHVDLFPEAHSRAEVGAMIELLGLPVGARILDVPCGWGRHTELFEQLGFEAFGADLSTDLLLKAEGTAQYTAADVRALPFAAASFDAAVNVFTSLGLFLDDGEDIAALKEIGRVLKPGGRFILESMHRDDVIRSYAARDAWKLPNGTEVRVRRRFNPVTGISYERLQWRRGQERGRKQHALKLRTAGEVDALLKAAGFSDLEYFGSWQGARLRHDSEHVIAVGRKPESSVKRT